MAKRKATLKERKSKAGPSGRMMLAMGSVAALASAGFFFLIPNLMPVVYDPHEPRSEKPDAVVATTDAPTTTSALVEAEPIIPGEWSKHVPTPDAVRGIYMTQCVVGTPSFRADLVKLIEETELNAVVIDLKDYTGKLAFDSDHPELVASVSDQCGARDMRTFVETLHAKGIYVIGRITVFQDPYYSLAHPELAVKFETPTGAVWKDHKGLSFIDVGAKPFWDYIITISREAHMLGFDELNYDYVRFPSDGPMSNIHFDWTGDKEKQVALEEFFAYLSENMRDRSTLPAGVTPPVISADLFGMVTTNYDDLNIGQVLERAMPYFDYIMPMVYPSHYPPNFNGWADPDDVPYELIHFVLGSAVRRAIADKTNIAHFDGEKILETVVVPPTSSTTATTTKEVFTGYYTKTVFDKDIIRPWLQDFDYGGDYDIAEVRAQIKATYDVGLDSWVLWAPSNRYTRGALKSNELKAAPATSTTEAID